MENGIRISLILLESRFLPGVWIHGNWGYKDADLGYKSVMEGDLSDGSIILMHDIHQPTVEAAKRILPEAGGAGL